MIWWCSCCFFSISMKGLFCLEFGGYNISMLWWEKYANSKASIISREVYRGLIGHEQEINQDSYQASKHCRILNSSRSLHSLHELLSALQPVSALASISFRQNVIEVFERIWGKEKWNAPHKQSQILLHIRDYFTCRFCASAHEM